MRKMAVKFKQLKQKYIMRLMIIGLASSVMSSLHRIWTDKRLSLSTKLCIYQTLDLFIILYASETWTVLASNTKSLNPST